MYGLANSAAQDAAGLKNCGWWSLPGSACWKADHPYEDPSILCALGIGYCPLIPPRLPAPTAPPIDQAGYAPSTWTAEDQALASQVNTAGVLAQFQAAIPDQPSAPENSLDGYALVALAVAGVAVFSMLRK